MTRWRRGEAEIEQMLSDGQLQQVTGAGTDGGPWLTLEYPELPDETVEPDEAATAISSARAIIDAAGKLLGHLGIFT